MSNIDKIFEKVVHKKLTNYFDKKNIIVNNQYGFRFKHSTTDALIDMTEQIRKALDRSQFAYGTFIDLKKAFDTVDHQILLSKLEHYGVRGIAKEWFSSYLSDRFQFVTIQEQTSQKEIISHGVPQGSVLGPLLFQIYINDLPNAISNSQTFLFADDTGLLYTNSNLKVIEEKVNDDLKTLSSWLNANKIALNSNKTEVILFRDPRKLVYDNIDLSLDGFKLKFSSYVKYLGILIDEHLSFRHHMDSVATKVRKSNGILSKLRHFLPIETLSQIYYSLFQSNITYGLQVWGQNISPRSRLTTLQKSSIRILTFSDLRAHSKPLFESLGILNISELLFMQNISLIYQSLNGLSPINIQNALNLSFLNHAYLTRGSTKRIVSRPLIYTKHYGLKSITYQAILNWNNLQKHYRNYDLSTISASKLKFLAKSYLYSLH